MEQIHPMPALTREKRTEAETIDRKRPRQHSLPGAGPGVLAEPDVEKMRGPKLVALWIALIALSWAVAGGIVYGVWQLVSGLI